MLLSALWTGPAEVARLTQLRLPSLEGETAPVLRALGAALGPGSAAFADRGRAAVRRARGPAAPGGSCRVALGA